MGLVRREDWLLERAKAIVMREQDVSAREQDIARRRQDLVERERELHVKRTELQQLRFAFAEVASGEKPIEDDATISVEPALARTMSTIAARVLAVLEMEPRAFSPSELFDVLELPPPIETLRTTLWKMAQRGLIARPVGGHYCARQHEGVVMAGLGLRGDV